MSKVRLTVVGLALLGAGQARATEVLGNADLDDWFGEAVAVGDFDCSGEKDLAILVGPEQAWQTTEEFLASVTDNLLAAVSTQG